MAGSARKLCAKRHNCSRRSSKYRKNPSKGWRKSSPHKGTERHILSKQCGNKCFLGPNESFPICAVHRHNTPKSRCKFDCRGILSAYRRSRQYKYDNISRKALKLAKKLHCWKSINK